MFGRAETPKQAEAPDKTEPLENGIAELPGEGEMPEKAELLDKKTTALKNTWVGFLFRPAFLLRMAKSFEFQARFVS